MGFILSNVVLKEEPLTKPKQTGKSGNVLPPANGKWLVSRRRGCCHPDAGAAGSHSDR